MTRDHNQHHLRMSSLTDIAATELSANQFKGTANFYWSKDFATPFGHFYCFVAFTIMNNSLPIEFNNTISSVNVRHKLL